MRDARTTSVHSPELSAVVLNSCCIGGHMTTAICSATVATKAISSQRFLNVSAEKTDPRALR